MPEGHTIHRLARQHSRIFAGHPLRVTSPQGRFAEGAALVDGTVLEKVDPYGKHLFYGFAGDRVVHIHLGLYGKFWPYEPPAPATHHQIRLRLEHATAGTGLTGPTACELITPEEAAALVARLGPDPLRRGADPARALAALRRRRGSIGVALMDQSVVAGVGNVFRAEALFVLGIHPERPAASISDAEWADLWETLTGMLRAGVRQGHIATVDPAELPDRRVPVAQRRYVYKQEHCRRCGTSIRRWDLAGRWAYACETCQPLPAPKRPYMGLPGPVTKTPATPAAPASSGRP